MMCVWHFQIPRETLIPDGKTIIWDSMQGFRIPKATYKFIGLLSCETTVGGHTYSTKYLTHRESRWHSPLPVSQEAPCPADIANFSPSLSHAANTIFDVQLSTPRLVKLLKGDSLAINCTVTAAWNTRVQMTWTYPGEVSAMVGKKKPEVSHRSCCIQHPGRNSALECLPLFAFHHFDPC